MCLQLWEYLSLELCCSRQIFFRSYSKTFFPNQDVLTCFLLNRHFFAKFGQQREQGKGGDGDGVNFINKIMSKCAQMFDLALNFYLIKICMFNFIHYFQLKVYF